MLGPHEHFNAPPIRTFLKAPNQFLSAEAYRSSPRLESDSNKCSHRITSCESSWTFRPGGQWTWKVFGRVRENVRGYLGGESIETEKGLWRHATADAVVSAKRDRTR
jgi:hypothetical protein